MEGRSGMVSTLAVDSIRVASPAARKAYPPTFYPATVDDFARGEDITVLREKFDRGVRKEDPNRILVWAGSGVGLMSQIKPAKVRAASIFPVPSVCVLILNATSLPGHRAGATRRMHPVLDARRQPARRGFETACICLMMSSRLCV